MTIEKEALEVKVKPERNWKLTMYRDVVGTKRLTLGFNISKSKYFVTLLKHQIKHLRPQSFKITFLEKSKFLFYFQKQYYLENVDGQTLFICLMVWKFELVINKNKLIEIKSCVFIWKKLIIKNHIRYTKWNTYCWFIANNGQFTMPQTLLGKLSSRVTLLFSNYYYIQCELEKQHKNPKANFQHIWKLEWKNGTDL